MQYICNDIAQFHHLFLAQTALGDPGGAVADAAGGHGGLVAGNGIAIEHDPGNIQNSGGHIAGKGGTVRTDDGFAVHIAKVGVGATV